LEHRLFFAAFQLAGRETGIFLRHKRFERHPLAKPEWLREQQQQLRGCDEPRTQPHPKILSDTGQLTGGRFGHGHR
jgi:hypothetical protein